MMGKEVTRDLCLTSDFDQIVVADKDIARAHALVDELADPRLRAEAVDVTSPEDVRRVLGACDVVANCTTYHHGLALVKDAIACRTPYVDLGGLFNTPRQLELGPQAEAAGTAIVLGCGATPGVTNLMAAAATGRMDRIDSVEIAFGSLRPLAASPGLLDTILDEFSPATSRFYYEAGRLVPVPAFTGAKKMAFLEPVGELETYYVPHSETHTLPRFLPEQPQHVSVRGSWQPEIMAAMRLFLQYGLTSDEPLRVNGATVTPRNFLRAHLLKSAPPMDGPVAFYLRVEASGSADGSPIRMVYRSAHPTEWGNSGTARMTGIPTSIGLQALAAGEVKRVGVMGPEAAFDPESFFDRLALRGITIQGNSA
ncbi:MAG: saccharopine dehydrogenase C-terminal domain-containing protein [Candidatus Dormibacteria bacterium]